MKATLKHAWPYKHDSLNLPVEDLDTALPFYETVLGFQRLSQTDTPPKRVTIARDNIQLRLAENGGDPTQDGCFFEVDDVAGAFAELKANGLPNDAPNFAFQRHGEVVWKVFFVVAPDGLCFCYGQRQS